jgi:hypothetical protein
MAWYGNARHTTEGAEVVSIVCGFRKTAKSEKLKNRTRSISASAKANATWLKGSCYRRLCGLSAILPALLLRRYSSG